MANIFSNRAARAVGAAAMFCCLTLSVAGAQGASGQDGVVADICSQTLKLSPGNVEYAACMEALSDMTAARARQAQYAQAYRDCASRNAAVDAPQFADCVLNSDAGGASQLDSAVRKAGDVSGNASYMESNSQRRRALQERACARLGLVPGQPGFVNCVIQLQNHIESASNPS